MRQKNQAVGILDIVRNGHGYLIVESKGFKEDLFIHKDNLGTALQGDKIHVDVIPDKKGTGLQGVVSGITARKQTDFSGIIDINKEKRLAFVRTSGGKMRVDFYIPFEHLNGAKNGELVVVRLHRWHKKDKSPSGIITKVLGESETHETEMKNIMFKHNIDYHFSNKVMDEANAIPVEIPEKEILKRRDMRDVLTLTIDPVSAKDFDDAISIQVLESGLFEIGVHIADVSHYIRPGSELDKEAFARATSVYLVDRCIPMLPEKLSNGICSLRPNEDKLCFSVIFEMDYNGRISKHKFKKTVINSDHRFSYEEAQQMIDVVKDDEGSDIKGAKLYSQKIHSLEPEHWAVVQLNRIAKAVRAKRFDKGAVSFNRREPQFVLDDKGAPIDVFFHESHEAHQLIEEYMLLANKAVATFAHGKSKPYVYRTHDLPDEEKLQELSVFVSQFGYSFNISGSQEQTKASLNEMLEKAKGSGEEGMISTLAIRSMSKAKYSSQTVGHYGLGFKHYSHFTSPIRRYPDLIAHRLLLPYMENKNGDVSKLTDQCEHCSDMENKAAKAQRDSIKYKQCEYLKDKVGEEFKGIISSVTNFGVFMEIIENGCDTMVSKEWLKSNNIFIDEENFCINNLNNGESYRLGDEMMIKIAKVNMTRHQIDSILILD